MKPLSCLLILAPLLTAGCATQRMSHPAPLPVPDEQPAPTPEPIAKDRSALGSVLGTVAGVLVLVGFVALNAMLVSANAAVTPPACVTLNGALYCSTAVDR